MSMGSILLTALFLLILVISMVWGLLRNLLKARIRGISLIVCAVVSVLVTVLVRPLFLTDGFLHNWVIPMLESNNLSAVVDVLGISDTLNDVLLQCIGALAAPIFCMLLFFVLSFLSWFVFLIIALIKNASFREYNEEKSIPRVRGLIWGAIQGLIIFMILMVPISTYVGIVPPVMLAVEETGALDGQDAVKDIMEEYVYPIDNHALTAIHRTLGGDLIEDALTDITVADQKADLGDEVDSLAKFAIRVVQLSKTNFAAYGSDEAVAIISVADAFDDSVLLPTIAGEIIYGATDAWLEQNAFLGAAKPNFGESSELFDPFFDALLHVLHDDARNHSALQADIHTVAEMVSVLAENGVFANIENQSELMETLSSNGIVAELISILGENNSMKVMIPEITNLGMRALATQLGIPGDVTVVYGDMLESVADALNDAAELPEEKRLDAIVADLKVAFDEAGVPIDQEIVDCYAVSMSEDLLKSAEGKKLTSEDVQAFFALYAMQLEDGTEEQSTEGLSFGGSFALDDYSDLFAGTVYENMTEEEMKKSGAAVLANACKLLVAATENGNGEDLSEQSREILTNAFSELLVNNSAAMERIQSVEMKNGLSQDSYQASAGLQTSDSMITTRVTMQDLLVVTDQVSQNITPETIEKEAEAIAAIFDSASNLMKKMSDEDGVKIEDIAGSVGQILDSLDSTASYGSDKSATLFTALMQSKTVRDMADMDMATATQMAQKVTDGGGSYSDTMGAVSSSVTVLSKLGANGETVSEEELIELIHNINPSTAGMIEVYVTPGRIVGYGVSEKYSDTSAALISTIFHYMADSEMGDDEYETEAKALNQILNIAISAKSHSSGKKLFGEILPSATETVEIFMSSKAVAYSLRTTLLDENGEVKDGKFDVFDLSERISPESADYRECVDALENYYAEHHDQETKLTLKAISALLGVPAEIN